MESATVVITEDVDRRPSDFSTAYLSPAATGIVGSILVEKYEVIETIGKGGVGAVYKVRHMQLDRYYALKMLQQHDLAADAILRFQNEARVISSLLHPNIVAVADFGVTKDAQPYMVMELAEGEPLSTLLKSCTLPPQRMAKIFRQVCDALAYAHESGIVHRDIKPSNIIVRTTNDSDHVTVVDFGLAKNLNQQDSLDTPHLTKTGDVFGTPAYMSPEQCLGQKLDGRADIYSLGCVMYEAVVGSPPFKAESIFEIISSQINESPKPFPKDKKRDYMQRKLEAVILRTMAKVPEDRYRFAQEVSSELKLLEVLEGGLVSELEVFFKVAQGRLNAGSRTDVWMRALTQVSIFLSIIVTLNLVLFMPGQLQAEYDRTQYYGRILGTVDTIMVNRNKRQFHQLRFDDGIIKMIKGMREVRSIIGNTKGAKERTESKLLRAVERELRPTAEATQKTTMEYREGLANGDITMLSGIGNTMADLIERWVDLASPCAVFRSYVFERYKEHAFNMHRFSITYTLYIVAGCSLLALLLGVGTRRIYLAAKRRKQGNGLSLMR